jgi:eukaryotic translation initiation factor 2C
LDGEEGRSDSKRPNVFRLAVRYTKEVNLVLVQELLRGNQTVKIDALECLSTSCHVLVIVPANICSLDFLDHLLRETPSTRFLALKRSFFHENNPKMHLGAGVYAYTGIYQAIRMVHVSITVSVGSYPPS